MEKVRSSELMHYGTKRHSGRYPWGSGENPYQHESRFLSEVKRMEGEGLSEKEIASYFGMSVRELRAEKSLERIRLRDSDRATAVELLNEGKGYSEIGRIMGKPESTIRSLVSEAASERQAVTLATADLLKKNVDEKGYIDVGKGVAASMGITDTRLETALQALKDEGYSVETIYVQQAWNPDQTTTVKVLAQPGTEKRDIYNNRDKIALVQDKFENQFSTEIASLKPVESISSKKVQVNYAEDGGDKKDGVIEIRRGAEGLDMGNSRYAQVRIGVDDKYYLKGMAVYADDLPDGVDIRFNTSKNRSSVSGDTEVFKKMKGSTSNPAEAFEAAIKPGGQRGYLNIISEEGDWAEWSRTLSSQMLSKQNTQLANRQLNLKKLDVQSEYEEISRLNNPVLKSYLLNQFADKCDKNAETLKAAALPRQSNYVILPLDTVKNNEIYAPRFNNGESVVLIRHPHGGRFEIPELKVNNNNKEAKRLFNNAVDAVGISADVAARLSGADFDGDTVLVIPNNSRVIKSEPALEGLKNFNPRVSYSATESTPMITEKGEKYTIKEATKQKEMGVVSNLITDMTLHKAPREDLEKAVKYSMVVIDSRKHKLDYKQARKDCDIEGLQKKYQTKADGSPGSGASTLISRAKSETRIPEVKKSYRPDPDTGAVVYNPTGRTYTKYYKDGTTKEIPKVTRTTQMRTVDDARKLSSGTDMEAVYAKYANSMKSMGNKARKEAASTTFKYSSSAAKEYSAESKSITSKIKQAQAHAPKERKAQILADITVSMKMEDNPNLSKKEAGKIRTTALAQARASLGGSKPKVTLTDKEWDAIQAGAISKSKQLDVFKYADQDWLKEKATPRDQRGKLTPAMIQRIKSRLAAGYTIAEIAESLGVSTSTVVSATKA